MSDLASIVQAALDGPDQKEGHRRMETAEAVLGAVPDNWAKVDGVWHEIPDAHFISIERAYDPGQEPKIDWRMEHSLPCRVRGMADCEVQEVWEDHLAQDGYWPNSGRYSIVLEGENTPRDDVFEDTRTVKLRPAEKS